jgi:hypothetical protein
MESSPLILFQSELISRTLDSVDPHEYYGFSQSCREALDLTKQYNRAKFADVLHRRAKGPGSHRLPRGSRSSPLAALPPELLYRILDFMDPCEDSGLSCACQSMLSIANQKLSTPENHRIGPPGSYISRTAAFVQLRKAELELLVQKYMDEMKYTCMYYGPPSDEDDADL